ncbi:16S rRNA (adenine(1518)-N(6)/adenine(1519)-N(6))-dimethyltransferase RsmA [Hellea balneolensis]|uniref:16S rRNA (adenine(1518)-N(6)/adenine(1519)-N(6))- dimethyltransferase RsmA n=1 Tax=Hellea balneolensis TaxID=287478 RepID=UPI0003FBB0E8|nr:16S rRNA (adenine(1518)-N(6)/adenine(1519)-N(6))-dimethyltransferase RsmA [Hellea balneolensis]
MSLDNLPTLSETVKIHKLRANKTLGQHFLLDMNVTDKIARLAAPLDGVSVAEIGPGPGGLTRALVQNGAEVLAIEMDDRFLAPLDDIARASGKLRVIHGNALKVDIGKELDGEIKIVANLPYNVGTKMLINWLTATPLFWSQAVLMFQKEVAERVVASPGDSAYGRLAILAQSVCDTRLGFEVPSNAFSPPPKVDSAVIVLEPLPEAKRFRDLKLLGEVTMAAFGQRRKMLRKSLKPIAKKYGVESESWCETCNIDPQRRPETLSVAEFQILAGALKNE